MNDENQKLKEEVARLEADVKYLEGELYSLRQFIRSLQTVADSVRNDIDAVGVMELLDQILNNALKAVNASNGSLLILDEDTNELVFVLAAGEVKIEELADVRVPMGEGIAGWVATHRQPTISEDVHADQRFFEKVDEKISFETHSILATPILGGGKVYGVVEILNKEPGHRFSVDDLNLTTLLCRFAGELLNSLEISAGQKVVESTQNIRLEDIDT